MPNSEESQAVDSLTLRFALRRLPKDQYDAYMYCDVLGFTTTESAAILSGSQRTIHHRLAAARSNLKKLLS